VRGAFAALAVPEDRFLLHEVDLREGTAAVEARYASQVRRNVRKAERLEVSVDQGTGARALDEFYRLFVATRQRLGVPTQPRSFVRGLAGLFAAGLGFVSVARFEGRPAAAAVFLRTGGVLTYKYGASDRACQHVRPTNLMFAHVIRWACEEGLATLDLGRTDLGHDGLAAFKRSWGATETHLAYTYAGAPAPSPEPSRAERATGALIRRAPPVVGRAIGQALYRHAG
jgi:lipid II:glycine glycyltransferase (peptidoglycan interpeptide bridge formation enzyme)